MVEYAVLTMLFGNDFLPRLSFLHFSDSVYEYLYRAYEVSCVETS
jgi:5'-3' exonuclease